MARKTEILIPLDPCVDPALELAAESVREMAPAPGGEESPAHLELGRRGEEAAAEFLRSRGLAVVERNWRFRQWELDLVCEDRDTLVFVEVKTRGPGSLAAPEDGLHQAKRARLVRAASEYLSRKRAWSRPCRFDLVTVTERQGALRVEHHENAFDLPAARGGHAHWQPW